MKAEEIRTAAEGSGNGPARQAWLNSADTYDALANSAEARLLKRKDGQSDTG
jgi:hypothetical protein